MEKVRGNCVAIKNQGSQTILAFLPKEEELEYVSEKLAAALTSVNLSLQISSFALNPQQSTVFNASAVLPPKSNSPHRSILSLLPHSKPGEKAR